MRKKAILITGAAGEIGDALIHRLADSYSDEILTLDLQPMNAEVSRKVTHMQGSILDKSLVDRLVSEYEFDAIYHLAALLSTRAEFTPDAAHQVNVGGTMQLLELAAQQSQWRGEPVKFIFPSSIAAYGLPDLDTKHAHPQVREWEWNDPTTMYGCNKLYCELLGGYYSKNYKQLSAEDPIMVDFRAVRFPGLISAFTVPSGGTSDYGPEMLHAAAQGVPYAAFVREDTTIPFMAMPDAVDALLDMAAAPRENLSRVVYNVTCFAISAAEFRDQVLKAFPEAEITFKPDVKRQGIVDSWPMDTDDSLARKDWSWEPKYSLERCFVEYLVPNIKNRYTD
ncbi:MAG: NAD-dependent epimerase/dehydratase family protein [Chloroflexi bacterium]|nr:MAG: NAD-dependent epimerase/dehydratase family protein [Chloroflexota bacterium]MBL1196303.1 NAD-dependent epimerase/dehydratase family protein [Chloroflexota bacterium]NOH13598.1 NAD-dependent epimerase/dehydratase family protein [Chloroflexota bacterium]